MCLMYNLKKTQQNVGVGTFFSLSSVSGFFTSLNIQMCDWTLFAVIQCLQLFYSVKGYKLSAFCIRSETMSLSSEKSIRDTQRFRLSSVQGFNQTPINSDPLWSISCPGNIVFRSWIRGKKGEHWLFIYLINKCGSHWSMMTCSKTNFNWCSDGNKKVLFCSTQTSKC